MIICCKLLAIGLLLLFSTINAVHFPLGGITLPSLSDLEKAKDLVVNATSSVIPGKQINLNDALEKFKNNTGKLRLEDFPDSTDLDELLKEIIYKGLIEYEEHNIKFPLLDFAVEQLRIPSKLFSNSPVTSTIININVCNVCAAVFKYFIVRTRFGLTPEKLTKVLTFFCKLFRIASERVCRGTIELNIGILMHIAKEKESLNELKLCATVFQTFSCFKDARSTWEILIPNQDTPLYTVDKPSGKSFRVLQITDLHLDPLYKQGIIKDCGEPLCCQNDQEPATNPQDGSGKWSDYRDCDMPYYSFTNFLEQITEQIKQPGYEIDFVYFTGDIIGHRIWNTSQEGNTGQLQRTYKMIKDYFGSIPVYSIIGNHEPHPINIFSPPSVTNEFSNRWIFDVMAEEWSRWLPDYTNETVLHGGYYTVLIKPGFRIIALNSNVCYTFNWWLLYDDIDPFHQLRWLAITLKAAETKHEFVHILSHVPPGDNTCIHEWTRQFRRIIERYSHIIKGQFNGHTHLDELRVFYNSSNTNQVINVAYNGGSFTTFTDLNPNYRYYTIDSESFDVLDYEQWTYNLEEANAEPDKPPRWYKQYSFKDAYGLDSLKYTDWEHLIKRMAQNQTLLEQYFRLQVRDASTSLLAGCKGSCLKDNLCNIVTTEVDDDSKCVELTRTHRSWLPFS